MKLQNQYTVFTKQPIIGWCVTNNSDVSAKDILKYGFRVEENVLMPDDIDSVKKLEGMFDIFDQTHPETTSSRGSVARSICLKKKPITLKEDWEQANAIKIGTLKRLYLAGHNHKYGHAVSLEYVDAAPVRFYNDISHARKVVARFNRRFGIHETSTSEV